MEMADLKSMQLLFDICNEHKVVTWQDELERIVKVAKFRLDMAKLLPIR